MDIIKPPNSGTELVTSNNSLPPIIAGHATPEIKAQVEGFYLSIASIFETLIERARTQNTKRTYRRSVMNFIEFMEIPWPKTDPGGQLVGQDESWRLLQCTVKDVQHWRDYMEELDQAPATLNARLAAVATFYKYLREAAAEMRLPITVPNPAHAQFISRPATDPVDPTEALTQNRARQLIQLPEGESDLAYRDRAILKTILYGGTRIGTAARLTVSDFKQDPDDPKLKIQEKGRGKAKRAIGINVVAADSIREYLQHTGITRGALFRARKAPRSDELGDKAISVASLYRLVMGYMARLPGAMVDEDVDGELVQVCRYTTHTLRATAATLLLEAGVSLIDVQLLLGHKDISTTRGYFKRIRSTENSASHQLVI